MSGQAQAANLTGMLSQLASDVGEMGKAYDWTHNAVRTFSMPKLDENDPKSLATYAEWARRNGKEDVAAVYSQKAAELTRRQNQQKGMEKMMNLSANLSQNWDKYSEKQRVAIQAAMGAVAQQHDMDPSYVNQLIQNTEAMRNVRVKQKQDDRSLDQQDVKIDNDFVIRMRGLDQDARRIALAELTQEQLVEYKNAELALRAEELADKRAQFNRSMNLQERKFGFDKYSWEKEFDVTSRMTDAEIKRMQEVTEIDWAKVSNMEANTELARLRLNEDITMGEFRRLIMGNEDRRAEDMQPLMREAKRAQIVAMTAQAGYTKAQTQDLLYELGFKRDTEYLREEAMKLDNRLTGAKISNVKASTENTKANTEYTEGKTDLLPLEGDYLKAQMNAIEANIELNKDRFDFERRQQKFSNNITEQRLELERMQTESGIEVDRAQIANWESLAQDRQFQRDLLVAETLAVQAVVPYTNRANDILAGVDVGDPAAVNNARVAYVQEMGSGSAKYFNEVLDTYQARAEVSESIQASRLNRENAKPITEKDMQRMGLPQRDIDQLMAFTPKQRELELSKWLARTKEQPHLAAPTDELLDIARPIAEEMRDRVFPNVKLDLGVFSIPTGIGNGLGFGGDGDAETAAAYAMARAWASGQTDAQVYRAGRNALMQFAGNPNQVEGRLSEEDNLYRYMSELGQQ